MKGSRYTPSNYPEEIEKKAQEYKRNGYRMPSKKVLRTPKRSASQPLSGIQAATDNT